MIEYSFRYNTFLLHYAKHVLSGLGWHLVWHFHSHYEQVEEELLSAKACSKIF